MRDKHPEHIKKYEELDYCFQDADYIDLKTIEGEAGLREFVAGMLSYYPWWLVALFRVREIVVQILGLVKHERPEELPFIKPEELSFTPGENASLFIVTNAVEDTYWVSVTPDDKHLKAYFGVVPEHIGDNLTRFYVFTTVCYLHWTGPLYFNLIRPFHHIIVKTMMKHGLSN